MRISYNWLKQYLKIDLAPERIAKILTDTGLEVEGLEVVESVPGGLKGFVIGHVKSCEKHPDSDHLHITTVDVGGETLLNIVCGAPNVASGQKVVVATIGTTLYSGEEPFEIKKSKIRGVVSEGMICAEDELSLGSSHAGIMVLDETAVVGMPAADYFKIENDYTFEIGLTPNRTDALSHIGVARDLLAALKCQESTSLRLQIPSVEDFKPDNRDLHVEIEVQDDKACPRYTGVVIKNVKVQESPEWLKTALSAIGIRSINNVVDISNWVLWEVGQPLHTFDYDRIRGHKVIIRKVRQGEKFVTLDDVERTLDKNDLMICDAQDPMCIAGVFGGKGSGITEETRNVFIESAYFNPQNIRKTARRQGLQTDASFRYERGADPDITVWAAKRAALLMREFAGGEIASDLIDLYPHKINRPNVSLKIANVEKLAGKRIEPSAIKAILESLDFEILSENQEEFNLLVPNYRVDVTREADVIEEILRIYGYNNIEISESLHASLSYQPKPNVEKLTNNVSDLLAANGFYEIMNNSFMPLSWFEGLTVFPENKLVKVLNPLSSDLDTMRPTLLYGGLTTIAYNINRKISNLRLFEFGNIYQLNPETEKDDPVTKRYTETWRLGIWLTGKNEQENWREEPKEFNFFDLKIFVHKVLQRFGLNARNCKITAARSELFFEGLTYSMNNRALVEFGQVHSSIQKRSDIKQPVFFADFDRKALIKAMNKKDITFQSVAKFPEVHRDLALLLDIHTSFSQIEEIAFATEKKFLKEVNLFDIYMGEKLGFDKKSYAVSFTLLNEEKTLEDRQIDRIMNKLMEAFKNQLNAQIR
ncbi:MAG: phenylalanine--tRNA ligase subunit beta [Bacteroidales bacterium]|jgi:phenylalanyl-tRNA synthetase beta chain|nr:phenylalanine--tRNA ligase subunit beta [Bacteroidales bacterium]